MTSKRNDRCVCCGRDSGVARNMPIDKRRYYIKGGGQLCKNCYDDLYISKTEKEDRFSEEEMKELLRLCIESNL